jgi:hypothetical protein
MEAWGVMWRPIALFPLLRVLCGSFTACALAVPAWAIDDLPSRGTLQGVTAVHVVVDVDTADGGGGAPLKDQLQSDVAVRLRKAGISVSPTALEYLHVSLHTHNTNPGFAFTIQVDFEQLVQLMRGPKIVALASTWGTGGVGIIPDFGSDGLRLLRASVADSVDRFINAYLDQNPRP